MNELKRLKLLIKKYNNMEANGFLPERNFYLGNLYWFVGKDKLYCNGELAIESQIVLFFKLKDEVFL